MKELDIMISRQSAFGACVGMAIVAGMWAFVWYTATSAIFSDLTRYGIKYRGEAYREIVATTERHILWVTLPIAIVLGVSLVAWGIQIRHDMRAERAPSATSAEL